MSEYSFGILKLFGYQIFRSIIMVKEVLNRAESQSQKSVQDIADIIREFAYSNKAVIKQIQHDALSEFTQKADIEVYLQGDLGFFGGLKYLRFNSAKDVWALQVFVTDLGTARHIVTIAIGEKSIMPLDGLCNLKASRAKQEKLLDLLK